MADSPMTSRQVAAGTSRGGRTNRETKMASPEPMSRATTIVWPRGPVAASAWPSSGLAACDLTLARPSGNKMVFLTSAENRSIANGPTITATTASDQAVNRQASRLPSRTYSSAKATASAGQAVAFIDEATPRARPAAIALDCAGRQSRANPRHMNPTIGTSVPPTQSSNAMNGETVSSRAQRTQSLAPATRSAHANTTTNTSPNHTRGSVSTVWPNSACGTPNTAISGK